MRREQFDGNFLTAALDSALRATAPADESFAVNVVDSLLKIAHTARASDLHLLPLRDNGGLEVLYRIDGVLQPAGIIPPSSLQIVSRLKVLSHLLTYRSDIPQEGRIRTGTADAEMRVSTFPTVHGEKAVVRFFVGSGAFQQLSDIGLPEDVFGQLKSLLSQPTGLILVTGPAGSGKTTTLYAAMRSFVSGSGPRKSLCSLEDPVEALIPGVAQTQVRPDGEMNYQRGLASLMRQDPEVILVGEIRDRETAAIVFQAALTGQLVLSTFHSGSAAEAISRLSEMEIEPYLLRSGLSGVLSQRLVRRRCQSHCGGQGIPGQTAESAASPGCPDCRGTGYSGRLLLCEFLRPDLAELGRSILNREDATRIEELAVSAGMIPLKERVRMAVEAGLTTTEELVRVFGT